MALRVPATDLVRIRSLSALTRLRIPNVFDLRGGLDREFAAVQPVDHVQRHRDAAAETARGDDVTGVDPAHMAFAIGGVDVVSEVIDVFVMGGPRYVVE